MSRRFTKLITITTRNTYYTNGLSADFEFIPTPACQKVLNKYRLKLLPEGATINVFYEQKWNGTSWEAKFPIEEAIEFTFFMRLINPYFLNFTDQTEVTGLAAGQLHLFENLGSPAVALTQSKVYYLPFSFDYEQESAYTDWDFEIRPEGGTSGSDVYSLAGLTGSSSPVRVDASQENPLLTEDWYDLVEVNNSLVEETTNLAYLGGGVPASPYFGLIRITEVAAFDDTESSLPLEYDIEFTAGVTEWKYKIDFSNIVSNITSTVYLINYGASPDTATPITIDSDGIGIVSAGSFSYSEEPVTELSVTEGESPVTATYISDLPNRSIYEPAPTPGAPEPLPYISVKL